MSSSDQVPEYLATKRRRSINLPPCLFTKLYAPVYSLTRSEKTRNLSFTNFSVQRAMIPKELSTKQEQPSYTSQCRGLNMSSDEPTISTRDPARVGASAPKMCLAGPSKLEEKSRVSLRKLVTGDFLPSKISSTFIASRDNQSAEKAQNSIKAAIQPQIRSFLTRGSRDSVANLASVFGEKPRKLSLLAESFKVAPHPGDKDIPLAINHVGLLESLVTTGQLSQLSKATLEVFTAVVPIKTGDKSVNNRLLLHRKSLSTRESSFCS